MKKTFTINLGGIVFHIDEDAYELLDKYLSNLRIHFSKEEGAEEIVHDMELRISELFSERLHESKQVISIADVEEVIGQMGKPEEFSEDATQDTQAYTEEKGTRRLYRNPDDKVIGGVCSGIAAYMGWDVTLVRLFTLVFGFLFQGIIVAYIISWILIPEAQTATEKLSMKGMKVNVENIGKTVTDGFENVNDYIKSGKPLSVLEKIGQAIINVAGFIIKALLVIIAISAAPFLFILFMVFFSLLMVSTGIIAATPAILSEVIPHVDWSLFTASPMLAILFSVCGILLIGLPIWGIIHALMSTFASWKPMSVGSRIFLVIIWCFALCAAFYLFFLLNVPIVCSIHNF